MITYFSLIGLISAFIGAILPVFVVFLPKIGPVSIYRNFILKRLIFVVLGCFLIALDIINSMNELSSTNFISIYLLLLLFTLISIFFNPKLLLRAIANPNHFSIEETTNFSIAETDLVVGYVSNNSKAVAYPLKNMVKPRHIINDTVDGKPILVTYCPLCRSGLVFDPILNSKKSYFKVAGLYRRNMVMIDSVTKTIWQQATGIGINGKLKDVQLPLLPYEICTWEGWKAVYPETSLAWEPRKFIAVKFVHKVFQSMFERPHMPIFPGKTNLGKDLDLQAEIIGIKIDSLTKAYPIFILKEKNKLVDKIGTKTIEINFNPENQFVRVWSIDEKKELLLTERHSWLAWKEFHPNTSLYKA